jgi:hypothetical protein
MSNVDPIISRSSLLILLSNIFNKALGMSTVMSRHGTTIDAGGNSFARRLTETAVRPGEVV